MVTRHNAARDRPLRQHARHHPPRCRPSHIQLARQAGQLYNAAFCVQRIAARYLSRPLRLHSCKQGVTVKPQSSLPPPVTGAWRNTPVDPRGNETSLARHAGLATQHFERLPIRRCTQQTTRTMPTAPKSNGTTSGGERARPGHRTSSARSGAGRPQAGCGRRRPACP